MQQRKAKVNPIESVFYIVLSLIALWILFPAYFIAGAIVVASFIITTIILIVVAFFKNDRFNEWVVGKLPK
jgi:hypothetical protein